MKTIPLAALLLAGALAPVAHAGPVEDWNAAFERAIQAETHTPPLAARNLALLHAAMHDAYFAGGEARAPLLAGAAAAQPAAHPEHALSAAAWKVCRQLFPGRAGDFDALLGSISDEDLRLGQSVADAVLAARGDDGAATQIPYIPRAGPGQWRRTTHNRPPELPHWGRVRPFFLSRPDRFRPPPPPALDSAAYLAAAGDVRELGGAKSTQRTAEQRDIAVFWSDFSYTCTPPGHWNRIARGLARDHNLDTAASARLFALLNFALADAAIAAYDCKYHHHFWRPVTALKDAPGADWESLLPNPSHPEYVSGHSAFSGAAAVVLARLPGGDAQSFTETSDALPGVRRSFASLSAAVDEIGRSRVYGGIHFEFSNQAGQALGRAVAEELLRRHGW